MIKKLVYTLVLGAVLTAGFTASLSSNGKAVEKTELNSSSGHTEAFQVPAEKRDDLLSLGFTTEEIESMDEEEYLLNKDLEGEVVASSTTYAKTIKPLFGFGNKAKVIELDKAAYYAELAAGQQK